MGKKKEDKEKVEVLEETLEKSPKEAKVKSEQALENKCPSCTATIKFNPKLGKFKCEYCGSEFTLEELKKHSNNASTDERNKPKEEQVVDDYDGYISYKCESCGAEIVADDQTASTFCVYCGNTAILKSKLSGKFTPDKMIPFQKVREDAVSAFQGLKKGRPLMPRDFNSSQNIEKIKGVYIPFWLYDLKVSGSIDMMGSIITTWSSGSTHYTKTDRYRIKRSGDMQYNNVPVDGSSRFDNNIMNSIEPFQYSDLVPYNHAYLSGFYAEKYDEDGEKTLSEARERVINSTKDHLESDASRYTEKVVTNVNLTGEEIGKTYALLPVWMVNVKYKNKMYIFAMNGQSGKFIGNIPLDIGRVFLYSIVIFLICMAIGSIISYVIYLMG